MPLTQVSGGGLADDSVSAAKIATGAVTVADIPDGEITNAKIGDGEIQHVKLANDCIDGDNIVDDAIHDEHIADDIALPGSPTTTTQSAGTNNTTIATTEYVDSAVGNLSQDSMTEGNTKAEVVDTGSDGHFKVETEGSERLRVIANGRVGIGTTTPSCELEVSGTGAVELPQGTTAQRPSATAGMLRYNSSNSQFEYSEGNNWYNIKDGPVISVDYLVIAGGGPGSAAGTGSYLQFNATAKGSDSTFHTITASGGGVGGGLSSGTSQTGLLDGGSGGGGQQNGGSGGSGTTGQGHDGGDDGSGAYKGAGGGGAGAAGENSEGAPGDGGDGLASSITGTSVTRAGGGGGGTYYNESPGAGGAGGGGRGGALATNPSSIAGEDGAANTGGGGGGVEGHNDYGGQTSGGGAGGYRTSFGTGNISGGNSAVEETLSLTLGTAYDLSVGAGGAKATGTNSDAKAGGSGVIIFRTEAGITASFSAGVVVNGTTVSSDNTEVAGAAISGSTDLCWTVTAAASDTVTFS